MATVTVGCRLPNGHWLNHPRDESKKVLVRGACYGEILKPYGLTEVDSSFWEDWKTFHAQEQIYTSGAIFEARSAADAKAKAADLGPTGYEKVSQEASGGVEPLTPDA